MWASFQMRRSIETWIRGCQNDSFSNTQMRHQETGRIKFKIGFNLSKKALAGGPPTHTNSWEEQPVDETKEKTPDPQTLRCCDMLLASRTNPPSCLSSCCIRSTSSPIIAHTVVRSFGAAVTAVGPSLPPSAGMIDPRPLVNSDA